MKTNGFGAILCITSEVKTKSDEAGQRKTEKRD